MIAIIFYSFIFAALCHEDQQVFLKALNDEAYEWIGVSEKNWQHSLSYCRFQEFEHELMHFVTHLQSLSSNFTTDSLNYIQSTFKNKHSNLRPLIKCLGSFSHTKIPFLEEKKKLSVVRKYITDYPQFSENIFNKEYIPEYKGKELGKWIKGLMEYYYVSYVSESETLSTVLLRSMATKVEVFKNHDFSYCVNLEIAGKISEGLQNMDINNIFLKVPQVFSSLKYLTLKPKCQSLQNNQIITNLRQRIKDIDMFKIMYYDYEPYVTIATQKYGVSKIKQLASSYSYIINNAEKVREEQILKLAEEERMKKQTPSDGEL